MNDNILTEARLVLQAEFVKMSPSLQNNKRKKKIPNVTRLSRLLDSERCLGS